MGKQTGLDMKLYRATGSPAWNLIDNVRDLSGPDSFSEADVSVRGIAFKMVEPALRDMSIEWEMVYDETDADFTALRTAYLAKTLVTFALADGLIGTAGTSGSGGTAGSQYIQVDCKIFKFERNEALGGANLYSVVAKPCYSSAAAPAVTTVS
jgi:hypothetical protein